MSKPKTVIGKAMDIAADAIRKWRRRDTPLDEKIAMATVLTAMAKIEKDTVAIRRIYPEWMNKYDMTPAEKGIIRQICYKEACIRGGKHESMARRDD